MTPSVRLGTILLLLAASGCATPLAPARPVGDAPAWLAREAPTLGSITGQVASGQDVVGGEVFLADATGKAVSGSRPSDLDALGRYRVEGVPAGRTLVVVARLALAGGGTRELRTLVAAATHGTRADLSEATTAATAAALRGRSGPLGPYDARAYGTLVAGAYRLLGSPKPKGADLTASLETLAATDAELAAALADLKAGFATHEQAISALQAAQAGAIDALQGLQTAQAAAEAQLGALATRVQTAEAALAESVGPALAGLRADQDGLAATLATLRTDTAGALAGLQAQHDALASQAGAQLEALATQAGTLGATLGEVQQLHQATSEQVQALQTLTSGHAAALGALDDADAALADVAAGLRSDLAALQATVAGQAEGMAALQAAVAAQGADAAALQGAVSTLAAGLSGATGRLDAIDGRVAALDGRLATVERGTNFTTTNVDAGLNATSGTWHAVPGSDLLLATAGGPIEVAFSGHVYGMPQGNGSTRTIEVRFFVDGQPGPTVQASLEHPAKNTPFFDASTISRIFVALPAETHAIRAEVRTNYHGTVELDGQFVAREL